MALLRDTFVLGLVVAAASVLPSCGESSSGEQTSAGAAGLGADGGAGDSNGSGGSSGADGSDGSCGPMPGGMDCVNPCSGQLHSPVCDNGSWLCGDPTADQCPDAGCGNIGNLVPVSCDPFPTNTVCDPFGTWSVTYDEVFVGCHTLVNALTIELGTDGVARVGYGKTTNATLSPDGCHLVATWGGSWTNPGESGTVTHELTLDFTNPAADGGLDAAVPTATGKLLWSETGACLGSGEIGASAVEKTP